MSKMLCLRLTECDFNDLLFFGKIERMDRFYQLKERLVGIKILISLGVKMKPEIKDFKE